ncbi:uncharacterized protein GGS22DRAFT_156743 [Annulohypoxylon maeteangense]|uniref:uncharacterized protein n=1 Tax=Annulohypoxylon maeteangense TaxID=1927788 RepID=UPI0020076195|nr:uncharacterized protein GGS22DRAFT_156743 [Annulohypoxylon maeteangense]KAI0887313.1 hypothetical protein GGS22DRAFT_156743 [Annulohypoxylon maeteangense]
MARSRFLTRFLPFSPTATPTQAATYLLGIALFSISFLVFLNSAVSFVITDLLGVKTGVGDIVGTLGFVDEVVALVACPAWGLVSDRLGVRWVAVLGYAIIGISLFCFVQARNVYPSLVFARIAFALGATASATMVTAILPVLTDDNRETSDGEDEVLGNENGNGESRSVRSAASSRKSGHQARDSVALSLESEATITPERFTQRNRSDTGGSSYISDDSSDAYGSVEGSGRRPSALAGYVGLFTGCGALVALILFLPLPAQFSRKEGITPAQAIAHSFYVVGTVALAVSIFVFFGLRGLKGEEGKGWRMLLNLRKPQNATNPTPNADSAGPSSSSALTPTRRPLPYHRLLLSSLRLGATDPHIALGYLGGFVARASTVAISLFVPLYVNAFFIGNGFCRGSPNDPSPELKKECRAAYVLASILTGVAQLAALLCAPLFGYASRRGAGIDYSLVIAALLGMAGYIAFPKLQSPEYKDVDGRGGGPAVFLVAVLIGVSQIGAIVCSLGSLGRGVLAVDAPAVGIDEEEESGGAETDALLGPDGSSSTLRAKSEPASRVQLKGSIAGVYSWCGGAAILLLTKLGGYMFDAVSPGAPFYMMAGFNGALLVASLGIGIASGRGGRFASRSRSSSM